MLCGCSVGRAFLWLKGTQGLGRDQWGPPLDGPLDVPPLTALSLSYYQYSQRRPSQTGSLGAVSLWPFSCWVLLCPRHMSAGSYQVAISSAVYSTWGIGSPLWRGSVISRVPLHLKEGGKDWVRPYPEVTPAVQRPLRYKTDWEWCAAPTSCLASLPQSLAVAGSNASAQHRAPQKRQTSRHAKL